VNVITRALASFKAMTTMRFSRTSSWFSMLLGSTQFDYRAAAGDGRTNAAVMACVRFVQRALPEAPLTVYTVNRDGELQPAPDHALQQRLDRPNPYYSGLHLVGALAADLMLNGNAYVVKRRTGDRRVGELWWVPSSLIEPVWPDDGSAFISHYDYRVEGDVIRLDQADVVHIRQGFDPQNIRKGLSDLTSLYREIATDNEAANWTGALLRNGAVPGVVISPEGDVSPSQEDLEKVKDDFAQRFGGDQRGKPLVMRGPTKVQVLSFNPSEMNLSAIRAIPEERITAVFGIPAAVVGLGTGLENTKVGATMSEMREQAYESCLIPLQRLIAAELQMQLVPDFGDPARLKVQFDLSNVRVLQDDQNALHGRARADLGAGMLTLNQALAMIGADPVEGEAGDVRYVPNTVTVKTLDTLIPEAPPAELDAPTPLRALPAGGAGAQDGAASRGGPPPAVKAAAPADEPSLLDRFEAGLSRLADDLSDDLLDAFEGIAETLAGRYASRAKAAPPEAVDAHEPLKRLLRGYVLKSMRQAADDLAPLTDGPVRIQRNNPEVRAAVADMEARLAGMAATTDQDFTRVIKRLERRPGSVSLDEVRSALLEYVAESYPSRAEMIAQTELGYAHARGVLLVAEKSGLADRVHVHDGDGDAACAARNGTVVSLEDARGIGLLHPHCRLRLLPVVEAA